MNITHSGFVAIVGRPNVGKSTLLNAMLGDKVAIVSSKPQTTRSRITGVYTNDSVQIVFLDTPGLHRSRNKLDERMKKTISASIGDVDAAVLVAEPRKGPDPAEQELLKKLKSVPTVLAINKVDTLSDKSSLMECIARWSAAFDFAAVVPVSAVQNDKVDELVNEIRKLIPEGPQYYPDDIISTDPERVVAAEIIREKLLLLLSEEVPHGTAVSIEKMHQRQQQEITDIEAVIYCERESHKGIIIGKGGAMIKQIGTLARLDIEKMLGCHVNLKLWVKVQEDWRNRENVLKTLGYN